MRDLFKERIVGLKTSQFYYRFNQEVQSVLGLTKKISLLEWAIRTKSMYIFRHIPAILLLL